MSDWVKALFVFLCFAFILFFVYSWIYPETMTKYYDNNDSSVSVSSTKRNN